MNTDLGVGQDTPVNQRSAVHGKDAIPCPGNHRTKARGHQSTLQQALDQRGGWDQIDALLKGRPDRGMGRFFFDLPGNGGANTAQDIRGGRGAFQDRQSPVRVMESWRQGYFEAVCSDAELATSLRAGLEGFSKIASHFALKMKLQPSIASQPVLPSWRSPAQHSLSGSLALQPQPL